MQERVCLLIEGERVKWEAHQGVSSKEGEKKATHCSAVVPGVESKTQYTVTPKSIIYFFAKF